MQFKWSRAWPQIQAINFAEHISVRLYSMWSKKHSSSLLSQLNLLEGLRTQRQFVRQLWSDVRRYKCSVDTPDTSQYDFHWSWDNILNTGYTGCTLLLPLNSPSPFPHTQQGKQIVAQVYFRRTWAHPLCVSCVVKHIQSWNSSLICFTGLKGGICSATRTSCSAASTRLTARWLVLWATPWQPVDNSLLTNDLQHHAQTIHGTSPDYCPSICTEWRKETG